MHFVNMIVLLSFCFTGNLLADGYFQQKPMPAFPTNTPSPQTAPPSKDDKTPMYTPLRREPLPVMRTPTGLPGVVGVDKGAWQNSDYLGYLSHNIPVTVELLLGKNVPPVDPKAIELAITSALQKEDIMNAPEPKEGPILPFIHFLVVVYAAEDNRFVVFTTLRLFEQISVVRKGFSPAGFWQGITWENQDVNLANANTLQQQVNAMAMKLSTLFAMRYHEYNQNLFEPESTDSLMQPSTFPR